MKYRCNTYLVFWYQLYSFRHNSLRLRQNTTEIKKEENK
jgi:hypothetical protein